MPKVPRIQENQRLNPQNPTGFQSSSQARLMGDAVSGFGRGLASLGQGMMQAEKANYRNAGSQAADEYRKQAIMLKTSIFEKGYSADAQKTYLTKDAELREKISAAYTDKFGTGASEDIATAMSKASSQEFSSFENDRFKMQSAFIKEQEAIVENQENDDVYREPFKLHEKLANMETDVKYKSEVMTTISEEKGESIKVRRGRNMVTSAIDGLISSERVVEDPTIVSAMLKDESLAKYITPELRTKLQDRATEKRQGIIARRNSEFDRNERTMAKDLMKAQTLIEANYLEEMQNAVENNDLAMLDEVMGDAASAIAGENPRLGIKNYQSLLTKKTPFAKHIDAIGTYKAREMAYAKGDINGAIKFVRDQNGKHIMPRNASTLLKEFNSAAKAYASDPSLAAGDKAAYALHKQILDDVPMEAQLIGPAFLGDQYNKDRLALYFGIRAKYNNLKMIALTNGVKFNGHATMSMLLKSEAPERFKNRQPLVGIPVRKSTTKSADIGVDIEMQPSGEYKQDLMDWSRTEDGIRKLRNSKFKKGFNQKLKDLDKESVDEAEIQRALRNATPDDFRFYETNPGKEDYDFLRDEDQDGIPFINQVIDWEL
jgi:hypothetical protein